MNTSKANHKKALPKMLIIGIVILFSVIVVILLTQKPVDLEISNIDITAIRNIMILEHEHLLGKPAEKIIDSMIEQQSLEVDAVTSATYSSDTIRKAIENALQQGEEE